MWADSLVDAATVSDHAESICTKASFRIGMLRYFVVCWKWTSTVSDGVPKEARDAFHSAEPASKRPRGPG